ncbi:MAG: mechanosensitive ion channel family protein [Planctomycetota bacterium]|jgi:MscS family membrane protein
MSEYLDKTFYGNTVLQWLTCMAIVLGVAIAARVLYRVFKTTVKKLTEKTESRLDDIVVDMVEEPIVGVVLILGVWYATTVLTLSQSLSTVIGHIMQFMLTMMVAWCVSRLMEVLFEEHLVPLAEKSENTMDDLILPIVRRGTKIIIWSIGVIVGLNNAGQDVAALIAGLGIGGLALAMAAKDTVANIFGGFTIFTDKPFSINDRIKVGGHEGTVTEIGVRSTRLKTLAGRVVTIPNSRFADSAVENVSWEPTRKIILELGLTYDTAPEAMEKATKILKTIADENEGVREDPVIFFSGFGDFAMTIKFIYYIIKGSDIAGTQHGVNMAILKHFNEAGLEFAFPTQTLYTIEQNQG